MTMAGDGTLLSWLHFGDLHIKGADEENYRDLRRIVALTKCLPSGSLDFAVLPGDNADDGTAEQFHLVRAAVAELRLPLHILTGDHDFKSRGLDAFHAVLGARTLPYAVTAKGHRCLFLDVVSAGTGGPDFRLGDDQLAWMERELEAAKASGEKAVIFMHTYPADLREGADQLGALLARPDVLCVDMGHTHYNELANDGGTIFMVTRSTGQIEEGPAGFSVAAVDGDCVSWRFKTLKQAWPFVLVTQPVDRRLVTSANQLVRESFVVRAKVIGDAPIRSVDVRMDDGAWMPMAPVPDATALWSCRLTVAGETISVRARDTRGREDEDRIECAGPAWNPPRRATDGSDRDRVGAWPEKGILGSQLGPNRNGRKW
jgi:Icc protein